MKAITKILSPSLKRTILIINFFFSLFKNCIKNTANRRFQKAFNDKKYSVHHDSRRNQEICQYKQNLTLTQVRNHQS